MDLSHKNIIGVIKEFLHDEQTARFEWKIPHYLDQKLGIHASPAVKFFNTVWNLAIHIKSEDTFQDKVYLHRETSTSGIRESVCFTIGYKKKGGTEEDIVLGERFPVKSNKWGPGTLWEDSLPMEFTITCKVWKDESTHSESISGETETEDASCSNDRNDEHVYHDIKGVSCGTETEDASCINGRNNEHHLNGHFKNLLLSGDHHDVLIKVEDKEFRAHKCVLACSPVFAAMFRCGMAESADNSVTIEDCDPDAFGKFLQYVYTGNVDIPSTSIALGMYYAGDKYDIPRLKEICVEFLKTSLTATAISDVLTLAARHDEKELMQKGIFYFSKHLEEVMLTVEWQRFCLENPIQANEMCLKAVQCLNKHNKHTF